MHNQTLQSGGNVSDPAFARAQTAWTQWQHCARAHLRASDCYHRIHRENKYQNETAQADAFEVATVAATAFRLKGFFQAESAEYKRVSGKEFIPSGLAKGVEAGGGT